MSKNFSATDLRLNLVRWGQSSADPNAAGGTAGAVGSFWLRQGNYPSIPTEMFLKLAQPGGSPNLGWVKQNLIHLEVFNVKDYGAVGDGVTNDLTAIRNATAAAQAAGGGIIYFPATPDFYNVVKVPGPGNADLISMIDVHDVVFFGDGCASKIKQTGDCEFSQTQVFAVRNRCSRIRFYNLYLDVSDIINPDAAEQQHGIQIYGSVSLAGPGPEDVEINGCYFGAFEGDPIRLLGEQDREVRNVRVMSCAFDGDDGFRVSRSIIGVQRRTRSVQVKYNWMTGSGDQEVDFEPTGGSGDGQSGPQDYAILGNHIEHGSILTSAVTLGGLVNDPSRRISFNFNTLTNGGSVLTKDSEDNEIRGNVLDFNSPNGGGTFFVRHTHGVVNHRVSGNVITCEDNPTITEPRVAIGFSNQAGTRAEFLLVDNNICNSVCPTINGASIQVEDSTRCIVKGNIAQMKSALSGSSGIRTRATNAFDANNIVFDGNLLISTGATVLTSYMTQDVQALASATSRNMIACNNMGVGGAAQMLRHENPSQLPNYRGCYHNVGVNMSGATYISTLLPTVVEGSSGPGPSLNVTPLLASGPEGVATATIGSFALNNIGTQDQCLFIKEGGAGVSGGNTGWTRYGGQTVVMGALLGSVDTVARFFAPGMALAVESSVEIQWVATRSGRVRNLRVRCTAGVGGGTNTYRLRKNGVDQTPLVAILNTATSGVDAANSFTVVAGDRISCQVTKSGAPATPQSNIAISMEVM